MKKYAAIIFLVFAMPMQGMEKENFFYRARDLIQKIAKYGWFDLMDYYHLLDHNLRKNEQCKRKPVRLPEPIEKNALKKLLNEKEDTLKKLEQETSLEDKVRKTKEFYSQYSSYNEDCDFSIDLQLSYDHPDWYELPETYRGAQLLVKNGDYLFGVDFQDGKYYRINDAPCSFLMGKFYVYDFVTVEDYKFKDEKQKEDTCNRCIKKMKASLAAQKKLIRDFEELQTMRPRRTIDELLEKVRQE